MTVPPRVTRYGAAAAASLAALVVTTQLHPFLDSGSFMVFLTAVVVSAGYGGLGPGLLATVLSVAFIDFFFVAPRYSLRVVARTDVLLLSVYALAAVFTSYFGEWLRAAKRRAESQAESAAAVALLFERHAADLKQELSDNQSRRPERRPSAKRPGPTSLT
jgi:K+-sensing histidine kinase KdpD